jgi:hypothetical protein
VTRGQYYTLNAVGGRIWELLASWIRFDDIVIRLHEEFDASLERLRADVMRVLQQLQRLALITYE